MMSTDTSGGTAGHLALAAGEAAAAVLPASEVLTATGVVRGSDQVIGLFALGGTRRPGIALVADTVGLAARARWADLVITGEGAYDYSSRFGKVVYGVAEIAGQAVRPCVVLAGQVLVGTREMRAMGVESAYAMVDAVGEEAAMSEPDTSLAALAERVARTWSH